jgi:soluble lytic murein transglycosylase-like protein
MNGRRKIICLGKVGLLTFALLGGVICSVYVHQNHTIPTETCEIITLSAEPSNYLEVNWIRRYNPSLSEADANDLYRHIQNTIKKYHADPAYQKGVTKQITPRLFLSLILRESGFRWSAISDHGAIGLCQVMPLHIPSLRHLGIKSHEDLLEAEKNIEAGVFVLMNYAKGVDSVTKALSRYNGGYKREKAGRGYAKKVLALYAQMR